MEGLPGLLKFGGLCLLLMRFGSGVQIRHGGDSSGGKAAGAETSRLDPVCGLINYHWLYRSPGTVLQTDGLSVLRSFKAIR